MQDGDEGEERNNERTEEGEVHRKTQNLKETSKINLGFFFFKVQTYSLRV